ncbi:MAG: AAA family ATPase [Candidatus Marsarchaeota archaeon]|nr:AAA family ATPase [Candidatus Marsarchaeota archaeon]
MATEGEKIGKLKTGISGLDGMLFGGIPKGDQVVIAGGPGCGKTLLCLEILYHNAAESNMPCLFVTFEERPEDVVKNMKGAFKSFNDIDSLIDKNILNVLSVDVSINIGEDTPEALAEVFDRVSADISEKTRTMNAGMVAIDSISLLRLIASDKGGLAYRRAILSLMTELRRLNVTAFLTVETLSTERNDIKFSPEFFIFDGILVMYQSENEDRRVFNLEVIKMRGTHHSLSFAPYDITPRGFRVFSNEQTEMEE